jgi:hypothetical protein
VPQVLHAPPPLPQALLEFPDWHLPAVSQQPFAQFEGPQVCGMFWQLPLVQVCVEEHCRH